MKERKAENRPVVRPGAVGWILEGAALLVLLADFSFTAWGTFALPEMPPEFFEFRGGGSMASLRAGPSFLRPGWAAALAGPEILLEYGRPHCGLCPLREEGYKIGNHGKSAPHPLLR